MAGDNVIRRPLVVPWPDELVPPPTVPVSDEEMHARIARLVKRRRERRAAERDTP